MKQWFSSQRFILPVDANEPHFGILPGFHLDGNYFRKNVEYWQYDFCNDRIINWQLFIFCVIFVKTLNRSAGSSCYGF